MPSIETFELIDIIAYNVYITLLLVINSGMGLYTTITLAMNSKNRISNDIYLFTVLICMYYYTASIINFKSICYNMKLKYHIALIIVSYILFVWDCVILFVKNCINNKDINPYCTVSFIYFIIHLVVLFLGFLYLLITNINYKLKIKNIHSITNENPILVDV